MVTCTMVALRLLVVLRLLLLLLLLKLLLVLWCLVLAVGPRGANRTHRTLDGLGLLC